MKCRHFCKVLVVAGLIVMLFGWSSEAAVEFTLSVQNHDPATSICGQYVEAWGNKVKEASGGRIDFVYYHGGSLVSAADAADAVENGTADIAWSAASIYAGKFPISEGVMLPLNGVVNARMGSKVMMDLLAELPEMQKEYSAYKVIQLSTCTYAPISLVNKKVETIQDIQGLRLRAAGATVITWAKAVGISPITVPTPETYENLQKNVIDGCMNDWHNISATKLTEVTKYILDYPVNCSPLFLLMNKDSYAALPADLQAIIDQFSGAYASDMAGVYWDSTRAWVYDTAGASSVEIYDPSPQLVTDFEAVREAVHADYINYLNGKGLDGKKVYDKMMEIIARYKGKYDFSAPVNIADFK